MLAPEPAQRRSRRPLLTLLVLAAAVLQGACSRHAVVPVIDDGPGREVDPGSIADAVPRDEPLAKYGNMESYVVNGVRYYTLKSARGFREQGIASWYGSKFHGRRTSSGEPYDMYQMTAAHKQLPLPTYVEVRNLENGRTATLKVNDRGPFHDNRIIDLSYAAALKLGVAQKGTAFVEVRALNGRERSRAGAAAPVAAPVAVAPAPVPTPPPAVSAPPVAAAPAALPAAAPAGTLYIQVGAFQDRTNAERLREQVAGAVPDGVIIREFEAQGRVYYRVQIGPVASVERADAVVAALEQLGLRQHRFISN